MQRLVGCKLPDVRLRSTDGYDINPCRAKGLNVFFCYPYTGKSDHPDPPDWDDIEGAHGSTPQARAFSDACDEYKKHFVQVFGISFQENAWQMEFVGRTNLRIPLLSDNRKLFSKALDLPTFKAGRDDFLSRLTIIARDGAIVALRYPVKVPADDAKETLQLIRTSFTS
jgi:peroxiredoxin